jgi:uncharacterized protein
MNTLSRPHLVGLVAGMFLSAGLVGSAFLASRSYLLNSQNIVVTGSARTNVTSDLVIWSGAFSVEGASLNEAHQRLKADLDKVKVFLGSRGLTNFSVASINIQQLKSREGSGTDAQQTVGYRLSRGLTIKSADLDRVTEMDAASSELVGQGVEFTSNPLQFLYTKSAEAKVEMLAEATKDARMRADQMAHQGGRQIDSLRSARMGVFQITPLYETETAWGGVNDTTSRQKTITAVISATFALR